MVFLASTLVGSVFYMGQIENHEEQTRARLENLAHSLIPTFLNELHELDHDANYLAHLPQLQKGLLKNFSYFKDNYQDEIYPFLKTFLETKSHIVDVKVVDALGRMIKLDLTPDERVEAAPDNQPEIKPEPGPEVISVVNTNYKMADYPKNKFYLSEITLLRKNLDISGKRIPVIEGIRPIFQNNRPIGMIVLSLNLAPTFKAMQDKLTLRNADVYLTNDNGDYLMHPDISKTFGFEFGKDLTIQKDFLKSMALFAPEAKALTFSPSFTKADELMHLTKINFDPNNHNRFLALGVRYAYDKEVENFKSIRSRSFLFSGILLFLAVFATYFYTRSITGDLNKITRAAEQYARGDSDFDLLIKTNDEVGVMAHSFLSMVRQINERTRRIVKSEESSRRAKDYAEEVSRIKTTLLKNLRKQKSELEKISKEKDDLLAIVSHDLKNPLAVIEASLRILLEKKNGSPITPQERDKLIQRSIASSRFALELITDLLDLARLEGGIKLNYEIFNLQKIIKESIEGLEHKAKEKGVSVRAKVPANLQVNADYMRILQVINNILGNALKFTPKGGEVLLDVQQEVINKKQFLKIVIKDTGIGIPKNMLDIIFDKYQQARLGDRETGTGLGLTICKNICVLHQGSISVESTEGQGSRFTILIPTHMQAQEQEPLPQGSLPDFDLASLVSVPRGNEAPSTILIVDDAPEILVLLQTKLKKYGHNIITANNGKEALKILKEPLPNLILLDLEMPIMDGIQTLQEIRKLYSAKVLPIIIHSSKITPDNIELFRHSANDYIQKPANFNHLLQKIQHHARRPDQEKTIDFHVPAKILLVDDSEDIYSLFKIYLKETPHTLDYAANGIDALAKREKKLFDIIFIDMNMPGMNGMEVCQKIRSMEADDQHKSHIILLTASNLEDVRQEAKASGFNEIMDKSLNKNLVLETIAKTFT